MSSRTTTVFLRAEVADFKRQIASAAEVTDKMSAAFDKNGQRIQTTAGRIARSAEINREAWNQVGTTMAVVSGAIIAAGTAALQTGIAYNTLQQTSRAALTTMLDGAEAANAQMDKLDDFARNSPFAKQVFIQAQRQMIGFGIETQKVLPYLDAIQNAVAAMGGSNNEIAAISEILAKIASQGKITARELMQLGVYGIDAATLIGSQMEKTGGQIREEITAGTIGAEQALDALAAGMQERFGGAAANVKDTFEGALDRVRAAWRDLASELAEPLVSAQGGGLLIDLTNKVADLMRAYQALPEPVKAATTIMGTQAAVATALGGAFFLLAPRVMDLVVNLSKLGIISTETSLRVIGGIGKTAGIAAVSIAAWAAATAGATAAVRELTDVSRDMAVVRNELTGVTSAAELMSGSLAEAAGTMDDFWRITTAMDKRDSVGSNWWNIGTLLDSWASMIFSSADDLGQALKQYDEAIAGFATTDINAAQRQFTALGDLFGATADEDWQSILDAMPAYRAALLDAATAAGVNVDAGDMLSLALGEIGLEAESAADSLDTLAAAEENLAEAQERATEAREAYAQALESWRDAVASAFGSFIDSAGAYDAVVKRNIEAAQAHAAEVNAANESAGKSWEDYYDGVTVSAKSFIAELESQVKAQESWAGNLLDVGERIAASFSGDALATARANLDHLAQQGGASAGTISTLAGATDAELAEIVALWERGGVDAGAAFAGEFENAMGVPILGPELDLAEAEKQLEHWSETYDLRLTAQIEIEQRQAMTIMEQARAAAQSGIDRARNMGLLPAYGSALQRGGGGILARAGGGPISGPGTSTSDSIPIMASDGEYMQNARAHSFWGTKLMDAMNRRDVPALWRELGARGFKDGGSISAPAPHVVTVPVTQTYESHAPVQITAYGSDIGAMEAEAERRRINDLGGR